MLCKRVQFALPEVRIIKENREKSQNQPQAESTLQVTSQKANDQQVGEVFFARILAQLIIYIEQRN